MGLNELGFTDLQEKLYRALLHNPATTESHLAANYGLDPAEVERACAGLLSFGVIKRDRFDLDRFQVPQPGAMIGQLIERRGEELLQQYQRVAQTQVVISELENLYETRELPGSEDHGVERLEDVPAVRDRIEELSFFTRDSVFAIQPGGPQTKESLEASRPLDQRSMRRGMDLRLIHEASVLDDELNRAYLRELVMGGAKVRVTHQHIDRMLIFDGKIAIVPVDPANSLRGALVVRHPGLLSGFIDLFHRAWADAAELPWQGDIEETTPTIEISDQDKKILELLASGCTDETSAREVGVSVRHLRRTISRLMQDLGASSRFEAGVEAARRGWL